MPWCVVSTEYVVNGTHYHFDFVPVVQACHKF